MALAAAAGALGLAVALPRSRRRDGGQEHAQSAAVLDVQEVVARRLRGLPRQAAEGLPLERGAADLRRVRDLRSDEETPLSTFEPGGCVLCSVRRHFYAQLLCLLTGLLVLARVWPSSNHTHGATCRPSHVPHTCSGTHLASTAP